MGGKEAPNNTHTGEGEVSDCGCTLSVPCFGKVGCKFKTTHTGEGVMSETVECKKCRKCGASTVRDDEACYNCGHAWFNTQTCRNPADCVAHGCLRDDGGDNAQEA